MAESGERKLKDIIQRPANPKLDAAEARAAQIVERAQLNEAIRVIEELEEEVVTMKISERFKRDKVPSESPYIRGKTPEGKPTHPLVGGNPMSRAFIGLTEDQYKQQSLLRVLQDIKTKITVAVSELNAVVVDIEATKSDY
ncbi:hypothetical protein A3A39_04625 [Candidatus Kaiserbacteria bacterium RIFCSPLOWO2_01_FULL_54_13]|uniref:Uncharacterized protein n=1 Tax=Candidatus Kaiserbacteria bacterium RIFCSPLOWO2_01_FULL_54_13 TaxID=1798512 RepID=A0A1F6F1P5_9BACT|nr:MAG: hypothetical protein A3A39_04625 [Candidatus Kaiserbacteria bacterium RIFCSPLOWO2_01_FULL_54_13]